MHSTQQKKAYRKPELNKIGNVASLTKAEKGGSREDELNPAATFGND